MASTRLTIRRLVAMQEALVFRLAGEIDEDDAPPQEDYDAALDWVQEELYRRGARQPERAMR